MAAQVADPLGGAQSPRLPARARLAAVVALVAALAFAVVIVVFVVRNGAYVALGLIGFRGPRCGIPNMRAPITL